MKLAGDLEPTTPPRRWRWLVAGVVAGITASTVAFLVPRWRMHGWADDARAQVRPLVDGWDQLLACARGDARPDERPDERGAPLRLVFWRRAATDRTFGARWRRCIGTWVDAAEQAFATLEPPPGDDPAEVPAWRALMLLDDSLRTARTFGGAGRAADASGPASVDPCEHLDPLRDALVAVVRALDMNVEVGPGCGPEPPVRRVERLDLPKPPALAGASRRGWVARLEADRILLGEPVDQRAVSPSGRRFPAREQLMVVASRPRGTPSGGWTRVAVPVAAPNAGFGVLLADGPDQDRAAAVAGTRRVTVRRGDGWTDAPALPEGHRVHALGWSGALRAVTSSPDGRLQGLELSRDGTVWTEGGASDVADAGVRKALAHAGEGGAMTVVALLVGGDRTAWRAVRWQGAAWSVAGGELPPRGELSLAVHACVSGSMERALLGGRVLLASDDGGATWRRLADLGRAGVLRDATMTCLDGGRLLVVGAHARDAEAYDVRRRHLAPLFGRACDPAGCGEPSLVAQWVEDWAATARADGSARVIALLGAGTLSQALFELAPGADRPVLTAGLAEQLVHPGVVRLDGDLYAFATARSEVVY